MSWLLLAALTAVPPPAPALLLVGSAGDAFALVCAKRVPPAKVVSLVDGATCQQLMNGAPRARLADGSVVSVRAKGTGDLCPYGDGLAPSKFRRLLRSGPVEESASATWVALLPESSPLRFAASKTATLLPSDLAVLQTKISRPVVALAVEEAVELDLDGDGQVDRWVTVFDAGAKRTGGRDAPLPNWTFVVLRDGLHPLATNTCGDTPAHLVGAIDLDGDGRLELIVENQSLISVYRFDGTLVLEGPGCCGLG